MTPPPTQRQVDELALRIVKLGRIACAHIQILGVVAMVYGVLWLIDHWDTSPWWVLAGAFGSLTLLCGFYFLDAVRVKTVLTMLEKQVTSSRR